MGRNKAKRVAIVSSCDQQLLHRFTVKASALSCYILRDSLLHLSFADRLSKSLRETYNPMHVPKGGGGGRGGY